jgi:small subunit ribosomal protein S16
LARGGRTKYPTYRIVAAESARTATGRFVEVLGHYNPHTKELVINQERVTDRMSHGAQPSNTVAKLLVRSGVELPAWVKIKTKVAPVVAAPEAPAADVTEVTEAEAAAEAEETGEVVETPEAAVEDEPRVGEVAEESAAETSEGAKSVDAVETAENAENAEQA